MWIILTPDDLKSAITAPEVAKITAVAGNGDTLPGIIDQVVREARGYVGTAGPLGEDGTIPDEIKDAVVSLVTWRYVNSFPSAKLATDARKDAAEKAETKLRDVAKGLLRVVAPANAAPQQTARPGVVTIQQGNRGQQPGELEPVMSIFARPTPFAEAMESHTVRALLPTNLSSTDLEKLGQDVLRRALFSARLDNAQDLQFLQDRIGQLIDGKVDFATVRQEWQDRLDARGYIAPSADEEGTITDLRSERRADLILQMNVQMAQGYGRFVQGQDQAILDHWPAQELYRQEPRKEHRDWPTIWREHGGAGKMYGSSPDYPGAGRMIALKDDPIWIAISRFGNPYPPFDYGSGMGLRDITRKEAMALGIIDAKTRINPQILPFNHGLRAGAIDLDDDLRAELEDEGYEFSGGSMSLGPTGEYQG